MKRTYGPRRRSFKKYLVIAIVAAAGIGAWLLFGHKPAVQAGREPMTPQERNAVRTASLKILSEAIHSYITEVGPVPVKLPTVTTDICSASSANCKKVAKFDMAFLTSHGYLESVPNDPTGGPGMYSSGYTIARNAKGQIVLSAPRAEAGATISTTVQ